MKRTYTSHEAAATLYPEQEREVKAVFISLSGETPGDVPYSAKSFDTMSKGLEPGSIHNYLVTHFGSVKGNFLKLGHVSISMGQSARN